MNRGTNPSIHPRSFSRLVLAFMAVAVALSAMPASAQAQRRIPFLDGTRGVREIPVPEWRRSAMPSGHTPTAMVSGVAQTGQGRELRIGKTRVRLSAATSVQSVTRQHRDGTIEPQAFAGREVTIFGRPTARGVDARLIIVRPLPHELLAAEREETL